MEASNAVQTELFTEIQPAEVQTDTTADQAHISTAPSFGADARAAQPSMEASNAVQTELFTENEASEVQTDTTVAEALAHSHVYHIEVCLMA